MTTRRGEPTRLEGFSDAVFAFALTLLVVSLEVPRTFDELLAVLHNFIAFAITFALLVRLWWGHNLFFRRYALADGTMAALNAALLFVVLLYVYPLKFLFQYLVDAYFGTTSTTPVIAPSQGEALVVVYGLGYAAVFTAFLLMYLYAYRRRHDIGLDAREVFDTRYEIEVNLINVATALLSIAIAVVGGSSASAIAGFTYLILPPARFIHGLWSRRRRQALAPART